MTRDFRKPSSFRKGFLAKALPPLGLALFTLLTRTLVHGQVYFADGPAHIRAILAKTYVIQPPGYWLFNRIAGLFPDPTASISIMNILFSVCGVVVLYFTALYFTSRKGAFLAALAYSCVFYIWFSGEIHSTYASQSLFPVATFYSLLRYESRKSTVWLWTAAVVFAIGAGMRPSDGAFLLPMLAYYAATRLPRNRGIAFLAVSLFLCLGWAIPTALAYRQNFGGMHGVVGYTQNIVTHKSIFSGVNAESIANMTRYAFPLLVAFWPILAAVLLNVTRNWQDWRTRMLLVWIVPGSLFFLLSFIADAPYLNFLSAAVILLAVGAPRMLALTAVWNALLFLSFSPIPSKRLPINVWNCYAGHFTRYGVQHEWWPNLSSLQKSVSMNSDSN